jgi:hypothetical protein
MKKLMVKGITLLVITAGTAIWELIKGNTSETDVKLMEKGEKDKKKIRKLI